MAIELEIKLFATLRDHAGEDRLEIVLPDDATVDTLLMVTASLYPDLAPALPTSLVAVNKIYAGSETRLKSGDEVAIFPPVSGGSVVEDPQPTYFSITDSEINLSELYDRLKQPGIGAIVSFNGFVRGETDRTGLPSETLYLEYEAYEEMAALKMHQVAQEIWDRWPLVKGIAIIQRVGKLEVGDPTTIVACSAAHRDQGAFEAARYAIDRLKEIVPVWKKEVSTDQSLWIEGDYRPTEADNR